MDETYIFQLKKIIEEGNKLKKQQLYVKSVKTFQKALGIVNSLSDSLEKSNQEKEIKDLIDQIYIIYANNIITEGTELKHQKKLTNAIQTYKTALEIFDNMYSATSKYREIQKIENLVDQVFSIEIDEKIQEANQLRKQMKFDEVANILNQSLNIAKKIYNPSKRNNKISKIKILISQSKVAKIKKIVLDLGIKFGRLQVIEIAEEYGEKNDLIVATIKEMINHKEIYAQYFSSSKAIAFDQQANIAEIDKLIATYREWEGKEVGKK